MIKQDTKKKKMRLNNCNWELLFNNNRECVENYKY